jgi:hypothetical protein
MKTFFVRILSIVFVFGVGAVPALAQDNQRVEIGSSLASVLVTLPEHGTHTTMLGVPTAGFGLVNPSVYASIFVHPRVSIEPQLGLFVMSDKESTEHWVNFFGNLNYFAGDTKKSTPFVFVGAGIIDMSGENSDAVKAMDAGAGYRFRAGDRLTFRLDGRYTHFFESNGNMVSFTLSIGGLFGK